MISHVRISHPFPGLRPFDDSEDQLFFGREEQIDEIVGRLRKRRRFLSIVGTSGSGKSSLIRAGIFPRLRAGGMSGAGSRWRIVMFRPGNEPIKTLAVELGRAGIFGPADSEDTELRVDFAEASLELGGLALVEVFHQARLAENENLLVVVDQFEEMFRYAQEDAGASAAFVDLLLEASGYPDLRLYVILVMRSDFLGHCAQFDGLPERVNEGIFLIPRLDRAQLERAIANPVRVAGESIDQQLVNELLNDVGDDLNQLPVLQHALMRTWEFWQNDHEPGEPVRLRHFYATGGLKDAINQHADQVYLAKDFSTSAQDAARRLFSAITERGADNLNIRRPIKLGEVRAITGAADEDLRLIIKTFGERSCSFLLPSPEVELNDSSVIDISHESLMRLWTRLKVWVDEEGESARMYRRLVDDAELSPERASLWADPSLAMAEDWYNKRQPNAAWAKRYTDKRYTEGAYARAIEFLQEGIAKRDSDRKGALAQKEAAEATERERLVTREAKARVDRYKNIAIGVLVIFVSVVCALLTTIYRVSEDNKRSAFASELVAAADAKYRKDQSRRDLALASSAAYSIDKNKEAKELLLTSVSGVAGMSRVEIPRWTLASVADHGNLVSIILDQQTNQSPNPIHRDLLVLNSKLEELSFTPDLRADLMCGFRAAKRIAVVDTLRQDLSVYENLDSVGGATRVFQPLDLKSVGAATGVFQPHARGDATALACSQNDAKVAVAVDGEVIVWNGSGSGRKLGVLTGRVTALTWSPSGKFVSAIWVDVSKVGVDWKTRTHLSFFDVKKQQQLGRAVDLIDPGMDCRFFSCALTAFSPDSQRVSWYDDEYIHTKSVLDSNVQILHRCDKQLYSTLSVFYPTGAAEPAVLELAQIAHGGGRKEVPGATKAQILDYRGGQYEAIRHFGVGQTLPMPVYDPDRAVFLANDLGQFGRDFGSGLAVHGFGPATGGQDDASTVLAGQEAELNWSESFVITGDGVGDNDQVTIADETGPLNIPLNEPTAAFRISSSIRLRDSGDGEHAVSFDSGKSTFSIWNVRAKPAQVLRTVRPVDRDGSKLKPVKQFAYDPTTETLTVLRDTGWQRYDSNGTVRNDFISFKDLKNANEVGDAIQGSQAWLSQRGNYIIVRGHGGFSSIFDSDGKLKQAHFVYMGSSPDDSFALGKDSQGDVAAFRLDPQFAELGRVAGKLHATFVDLSRDQKKVAFVDRVSGDIELLERSARPGQEAILDLGGRVPKFSASRVAFSVSGHYIVAQYQESRPGKNRPRQLLRVFSIDPEDWRRAACLMSGSPMTENEIQTLAGGRELKNNGCEEFTKEMFHR